MKRGEVYREKKTVLEPEARQAGLGFLRQDSGVGQLRYSPKGWEQMSSPIAGEVRQQMGLSFERALAEQGRCPRVWRAHPIKGFRHAPEKRSGEIRHDLCPVSFFFQSQRDRFRTQDQIFRRRESVAHTVG